MRVLTPHCLSEALDLLAGDATLKPVAGGTDLLVSWPHRPKDNLSLLDLSRLHAELAPMRMTDGHLELGALTTYWDVITYAPIAGEFPLLIDAARQVGAIQIQTRGTWAGNVANASPAADGVPVMIAYDAEVVLGSRRGRRTVPLCDYYTGYKQTRRAADELILAIRLPRQRRDVHWFHKVGARQAQAITKVGVAVVHGEAGWRVVANSVAPFVCRCRNMEAALESGLHPTGPEELRAIVVRDISPIDDLRSTADYRLNVLARLLYFAPFMPGPANA